jgi:membrane-associated phospholipid phosphatase
MELKETNTRKNSWLSFLIVPLLSLLFLLFANFTTGIRGDHYALVILVNTGFIISAFTRRLFTGLAIIIVYWIIYDSMKAWPNYEFNSVDIAPLYNLEKSIFGIQTGSTILTPNEYLLQHTNAFLDTACGIFYLAWIPLPLLFAFYLYFKNKNLFLRFCMAFFLVNCIGFIIYYWHPAAPPWYYEAYGDILHEKTKSYAAGLLRFDHLYGISLFEGLYSKGSNVFAAMPSLHSSYPLIGFIYSLKLKPKFFRILFATFMVGIWFSAIYLNHHYILDVIAGIGCGLVGVYFLERFLLKRKLFEWFMKGYENKISVK